MAAAGEREKQSGRDAMARDLVPWATCFVLSLAQWSHVAFFFQTDFAKAVQAEHGVVTGYPHWRVFQSRVLGPWLENGLRSLFGFDLATSHIIVAIVILTLCGVAMFHAGRAINGRQAGWAALLALHVLFPLTMARPWLYIWDYFVLLTAALFLFLVVRRAPSWAFLLLMSVAFLNHESAIFIGVWMVAQALADAWAEGRHPDWRLLCYGVLGSFAGILLTEYLRSTLLIKEIGWELFNDVGSRPADDLQGYVYFHIQLPTNLKFIYFWITQPNAELLFLKIVPLLVALALAIMLVVRHGIKGIPLAAYAVTQVAALLMFALTAESRTLLQLVPFLCLGGMLAAKSDWKFRVG